MSRSACCRFALVLTFLFGACAPAPEVEDADGGGELGTTVESTSELTAALERGMASIHDELAAVDSVFAPLPLMRPAEEDALRRYGNAAQLAVARRIGIPRGAPEDEVQRMEAEGALVRLEDSAYWVIRDLDYSTSLAVPELRDALEAIGRDFQLRLEEVGAPPLRFEISSVLRSATDQERLRAVNPNAALGESTHEYGTTVDIAYNAFAAPGEVASVGFDEGPAGDFLQAYRVTAWERIAARRALEIKAILGATLLELQDDGRIMVTLERLQPVFHLTAVR